jgi:hypothetical protein
MHERLRRENCNDLKVTSMLLHEPSERVTKPAENLRCTVGSVLPWLQLITISYNPSNIRLRRTQPLIFGFLCSWVGVVGQAHRLLSQICDRASDAQCPTIASWPRHWERCGAGVANILGVMINLDSTVTNHRSQIALDLVRREVFCTPLPGDQQRCVPGVACSTFHCGLGRGTGAGRGRGVGAGLGVTVGVAVAVAVGVGVGVGVSLGVGVGAAGTIA